MRAYCRVPIWPEAWILRRRHIGVVPEEANVDADLSVRGYSRSSGAMAPSSHENTRRQTLTSGSAS